VGSILLALFLFYYVAMAVYFVYANIRLNIRSGLTPIPSADWAITIWVALIVPFVPMWPNWGEINRTTTG